MIRVAIFHVTAIVRAAIPGQIAIAVIAEASGASGDILVQRVGGVITVDVAIATGGGAIAGKGIGVGVAPAGGQLVCRIIGVGRPDIVDAIHERQLIGIGARSTVIGQVAIWPPGALRPAIEHSRTAYAIIGLIDQRLP